MMSATENACAGTAIDSGILYYTQTDSMLLVPAAPREIKSLLEARNELAVYMARERPVLEARRRKASKSPSKACSQPPIFRDSASPAKPSQAGSQLAVATATQSMEILPPTIDNFRECRSCYSVKGCMLFRKVRPLSFALLYLSDLSSSRLSTESISSRTILFTTFTRRRYHISPTTTRPSLPDGSTLSPSRSETWFGSKISCGHLLPRSEKRPAGTC